MRTLALLAALLGLVAPARADDRAPLVTLEMHGIFGDELLHGPSTSELVVVAESHARTALRGRVEITVDPFVFGAGETTYVARLDLPPGARRRAIVPVFVSRRGASFRLTYVEDGRVLAREVTSTGYDELARGVVVLANPARLRSGLLDLKVRIVDPARSSGEATMVLAPVGVVGYEPRTGEPILPRTPEGYGSVALVVATASELERLDEGAFATLRSHVEAGGRLLVVPRDPGELAGPHVAALFGSLRLEPSLASPPPDPFLPEGLPNEALVGPGVTSRSFGAERRLGFGRVAILRYDANAGNVAVDPAFRRTVRALVEDAAAPRLDAPLLPFGRGLEGFSVYDGYNAAADQTPLLALRQALDPNEAFEGAILVVGCLLFVYVIAVGPLTFAIVRRKNRPLLALGLAPTLALVALAALVAVGFVGKGVSSRHRAATWLETTEGSPRAFARTYAGLFFTRPGVATVEAPREAMVRPIGNDESSGGRVDVTELPPHVENLRGNVWETRLVRFDGIRSLGGGVHFEGPSLAPTAVVNRTRETLHDAVVIDGEGRLFPVGTLAPGARKPVGARERERLDQTVPVENLRETRVRGLASLLGVPRRETELLVGLFAAVRGRFARDGQVALLARIEDAPRPLGGRFAEERGLVLLRVASRPELVRLGVSEETAADVEADP